MEFGLKILVAGSKDFLKPGSLKGGKPKKKLPGRFSKNPKIGEFVRLGVSVTPNPLIRFNYDQRDYRMGGEGFQPSALSPPVPISPASTNDALLKQSCREVIAVVLL